MKEKLTLEKRREYDFGSNVFVGLWNRLTSKPFYSCDIIVHNENASRNYSVNGNNLLDLAQQVAEDYRKYSLESNLILWGENFHAQRVLEERFICGDLVLEKLRVDSMELAFFRSYLLQEGLSVSVEDVEKYER